MNTDKDLGLGSAEAIRLIREDLMAAQATTRTRVRKAGVRVPFVKALVGGEASSKQESLLTFGEPVDLSGNPVKVALGSDEK